MLSHPLAALPPGYMVVLAVTRIGPGPHMRHCRLCTALAVGAVVLWLTDGLCTTLFAVAALARCPRGLLWWPGGLDGAASSSRDRSRSPRPARSTPDSSLSTPEGRVQRLVADLLKWQRDVDEKRLPSRSRSASPVEKRLAVRLAKLTALELSPEERAALESVPVETSQADTASQAIARLVADVLAFQEEVGEKRLPSQGAASEEEQKLAKRWSDWRNATHLTAEQRALLESVPVETSQADTASQAIARLVADVLAFQEEVGEKRLPSQGAASKEEQKLAKRWSHWTNAERLTAEQRAALESVALGSMDPGDTALRTIARLVAEVLAFQKRVGEERLPSRGADDSYECRLAKRWSDWTNATDLTCEQEAALQGVPVQPVQDAVHRLVEDVRAWQQDTGEVSLPRERSNRGPAQEREGDPTERERLLAQRWRYWVKHPKLTPEQRAALESVDGYRASRPVLDRLVHDILAWQAKTGKRRMPGGLPYERLDDVTDEERRLQQRFRKYWWRPGGLPWYQKLADNTGKLRCLLGLPQGATTPADLAPRSRWKWPCFLTDAEDREASELAGQVARGWQWVRERQDTDPDSGSPLMLQALGLAMRTPGVEAMAVTVAEDFLASPPRLRDATARRRGKPASKNGNPPLRSGESCADCGAAAVNRCQRCPAELATPLCAGCTRTCPGQCSAGRQQIPFCGACLDDHGFDDRLQNCPPAPHHQPQQTQSAQQLLADTKAWQGRTSVARLPCTRSALEARNTGSMARDLCGECGAPMTLGTAGGTLCAESSCVKFLCATCVRRCKCDADHWPRWRDSRRTFCSACAPCHAHGCLCIYTGTAEERMQQFRAHEEAIRFFSFSHEWVHYPGEAVGEPLGDTEVLREATEGEIVLKRQRQAHALLLQEEQAEELLMDSRRKRKSQERQ